MNKAFSRMNGSRAGRGFTLIELLVTMAVLTILISVGVPMYGQYTEGAATSSRTSALVSALNLARSEAVARREAVRVEAIGGDWANGLEVRLVSTDEVLRAVQATGGDAHAAIAETNALTEVDFDGQGRASAALDVSICPEGGGGKGRSVTLNRFGRVSLVVRDCPET